MERRAMLRMDISTLRVSELRTLLATARARGDAALADQVAAEIAGRAGSRRARPAPAFATDEADEVLPIESEPMALEFQLSKTDPAPSRRWPIGLAVAGVLAAGAAAWGLNGAPALLHRRPPPPAPPAPPAPATLTASPPPAPRAMSLRTETPVPPAAPEAASPEPPATADARPAREPPARLDPCAAPPSPAERLLCNDLALNLLDHEMREAYGRAMEAGADPVALRVSQAEWRRARDPVADPQALAGLYDRRIRELKAAAEPPPP